LGSGEWGVGSMGAGGRAQGGWKRGIGQGREESFPFSPCSLPLCLFPMPKKMLLIYRFRVNNRDI